MNAPFLRACVCLLLGCLLTACPETTVDADFGLKPAVLKPDDWNGSWIPVNDDDTILFNVVDAAQGVLRMTESGKNDDKPDEFRLRRASADPDEKLLFFLMHDKDDQEDVALHLMREADEGVILAWAIDDLAVEKAIKAGELKGTTRRVKDDPHNHLVADPASYPRLLEPRFWKWSEPFVLKRVKP